MIARDIGIFSLIGLILSVISMILFICFGIVSIICTINKKISPYLVFAAVDCLTGIAALIFLKGEWGYLKMLAVPSAVLALIIDLILWNKNTKSPKISDLHKYNENK